MHPLLIISLIVIIGIPVLTICVLEFFKWLARRQEKRIKEFERVYYKTQGAIFVHEPYKDVCNLFTELSNLKWKNKEMTQVLVDQFAIEYESERKAANKEREQYIKRALLDHVEPVKRKLKTVKV